MAATWSRSRTTGDFDAARARDRGRDARRGADVIYQACFVDGDWRGFADFVERQADGGYEVVDTKLARHSKPSYVLQLCFYSEQVARIQGGRCPERMHVVLGTHERESLRVADFLAYYHRVRERFVGAVAGRDRRLPRAGLVLRPLRLQEPLREPLARGRPPEPRRTAAARPGRRLEAAGIAHGRRARARRRRRPSARDGAAHVRDAARPGGDAGRRAHRRPHAGRCSRPSRRAASSCCRRRATGDLFFDIEGDPFWEPGRGLEYLWGIVDTAERVPAVLGARPRAGAACGRGRRST